MRLPPYYLIAAFFVFSTQAWSAKNGKNCSTLAENLDEYFVNAPSLKVGRVNIPRFERGMDTLRAELIGDGWRDGVGDPKTNVILEKPLSSEQINTISLRLVDLHEYFAGIANELILKATHDFDANLENVQNDYQRFIMAAQFYKELNDVLTQSGGHTPKLRERLRAVRDSLR
jgi:hypothetical protein